jgi:transcriptional regulator of acetoin/glycerol metabolism
MPRSISQRMPLMAMPELTPAIAPEPAPAPTPPVVAAEPVTPDDASGALSAVAEDAAPLSMAEVEAAAIQRALRMTSGNVSLAARLLKIGRATLYRRITELALDVASLRPDR